MTHLRLLLCFLCLSSNIFSATNSYLYSATSQRSPFDTTQEKSNVVDKDHLTLNFQDIPVR